METNRFYRDWVKEEDLFSFTVTYKETDLFMRANKDLHAIAHNVLLEARNIIESYIQEHPSFLDSLVPLPFDTQAHPLIQEMYSASQQAHVGPMASVAGAISEYVGKRLLQHSSEVLIENGGDIFLAGNRDRHIGIYAGTSRFTNGFSIQIRKDQMPCGICTSSGTVGHSLSMGKADAVCIIADSAPFADAMATHIGNTIKEESDIQKALDSIKDIKYIKGVVLIKGNTLGIQGDLTLIPNQGITQS